MNITIYSFFTAILCFNIFIVLFSILRHRLDIYTGFSLYPLFFVIAFTVLRLIMPIETSFTREFETALLLPGIQRFLQTKITLGVFQVSYSALFVTTSITISVYLFFKLFKSIWRNEQFLRGFQSTDSAVLIALMEEILDETNVRKPYILIVNPNVDGAIICGFRKPVIMISEKSLALSDNQIRAILRHEWQHYISKDLWIKLIIQALCCIMWWNPFIYLLKLNLDKTLEIKCDLDATRNLSAKAKLEYIESIFRLACLHYNDNIIEEYTADMALGYKGSSDDLVHERFLMLLPFERRNKKISIACCTILSLLFLSSFGVVIQPIIASPVDDINEIRRNVHEEDHVFYKGHTPENTYILKHQDGTYSVFFQGNFRKHIETKEDLEFVLQAFEDISIVFEYD